MICRTASYVLTAVLTLYLPDSSDLLPEDSQLSAERRKQCRGTRCYSPRPLWRSISSCSQDSAIYATSKFSPSASTHLVIVTVAPDEVAAITVKLFDQTLLADMEMLYIKETVFGVRDGAPLMDCTHPCLVALAAASHWPQHRTGRCIRTDRRTQDATAPVCSPACDMFFKTQATPLWSARRWDAVAVACCWAQ
jgi:hypothetical protein